MPKKIKVLHVTTHNENCGIGKYLEMFIEAMRPDGTVSNDIFETSPNQLRGMASAQKQEVYNNLRKQLANYDILHIQHEFSFMHTTDFPAITAIAKELGKKIVITLHTSPSLAYEKPELVGLGPVGIVRYLKQVRRKQMFDAIFTKSVLRADTLITHNTIIRSALVELGVPEEKVHVIVLPVPLVSHKGKNSLISNKLNRRPKDIIIATTGFIHEFKGTDHAIKALTYLPSNYKLAVIGGMHIDHDHEVYNKLADLIYKLDLRDRVYITGYIDNDDELNAMIRDCDICVYPYERRYYSNISSAALNNAFANHKPVIAYPTLSFIELNAKANAMILTGACAYYELAREVERVDLVAASEKSKVFSIKYSYSVIAKELIALYFQDA